MSKPHKHAELIKAWADGAEIEVYNDRNDEWEFALNPFWVPSVVYRIKPEPKPDNTDSLYVYYDRFICVSTDEPNLKLTFDGETGKLKSAEVL